MSHMKVYISGVHSGPNPSPGLGVARALRIAYPDLKLIAVDYSTRSSGLHSMDFDDVWVQRPWDELDLGWYAKQIGAVLDAGNLWLSGLDLEVAWLAEAIGAHSNALVPPLQALRGAAKPSISAHASLPVQVPPFMPVSHPDWDLHSFCREHGWRVWVKGPYYEARRIWSWTDLCDARATLTQMWSTHEVFLQADISGHEESVAFCAYDGALLDCIYMSKRDVTPEGKTWAGHIAEVSDGFRESLREVVGQLKWTGGAEIECIRDSAGQLWVIDWNPRFPAWIYGAVIAGRNLPALLVSAATGFEPVRGLMASRDFSRVVHEIPCRTAVNLPSLPELSAERSHFVGKHPSGMPRLAKRFQTEGTPVQGPGVSDDVLDDLTFHDLSQLDTPARIPLSKTARSRFETFAQASAVLSAFGPKVKVAYSIKTDPSNWLLSLAREHGMLAEAISQLEVRQAVANGFSVKQIVLNGPAKWWPARDYSESDFRAVFADSVEELRLYADLLQERVGLRLRLPFTQSRFGIPLDPFQSFEEMISVVGRFPSNCALELHFHMASSSVGTKQWWRLYDSFLRWSHAIEKTTSRSIRSIDVGGGWFPDDADHALESRMAQAVTQARSILPNLEEILLEPGKALSQPASALVVRLLEIRHPHHDGIEAVVDGAISDLPMSRFFPHRILAADSHGKWHSLGRGDDRLVGRLCMESDILAENIRIPETSKPGDILVICDAGAYDRSMSYVFGQG